MLLLPLRTDTLYVYSIHTYLIDPAEAGRRLLMSTCLDIPLLFFPNIFVLVCEHPAHWEEWRTILQGHRHYAINMSKIPHEQEFIKNLWYVLMKIIHQTLSNANIETLTTWLEHYKWNIFKIFFKLSVEVKMALGTCFYWKKQKLEKRGLVYSHCLYNNP